MADKLTQQITDALGKSAAEAGGLPLLAVKNEPGLFPAAARTAAQKALADGLLRLLRTEVHGKQTRELFGLTDKGWEFLLAAVNPKQVLEDFVRAIEARQGEVGELLSTARQMAESLHGMKDAVARVLPRISTARILEPERESTTPTERGVRTGHLEPLNGTTVMHATALLEAPICCDLAEGVLAQLADWSGSAGEDCPLPELYRSLTMREPQPTLGEYHDCLRKLHAEGAIYLHPWTGPLYALPEPSFALLVGHGIAYYASTR